MLKIVLAGCHQGSLQYGRPLRVGLCEPPHLVRGHAKITEHLAEWLAAVYHVEELLPHANG